MPQDLPCRFDDRAMYRFKNSTFLDLCPHEHPVTSVSQTSGVTEHIPYGRNMLTLFFIASKVQIEVSFVHWQEADARSRPQQNDAASNFGRVAGIARRVSGRPNWAGMPIKTLWGPRNGLGHSNRVYLITMLQPRCQVMHDSSFVHTLRFKSCLLTDLDSLECKAVILAIEKVPWCMQLTGRGKTGRPYSQIQTQYVSGQASLAASSQND